MRFWSRSTFCQRSATVVPRRAPIVAAIWMYVAKLGRARSTTLRTSTIGGTLSTYGFVFGGSADDAGLLATSFLRIAQLNIAWSWLWQRRTTDGDSPDSSSSWR